jgi:MFS family permease
MDPGLSGIKLLRRRRRAPAKSRGRRTYRQRLFGISHAGQYRSTRPSTGAEPCCRYNVQVTDNAPVSRADKAGLLLALYLAQGLPYGFFTLALPVLLRDAGLSLTAISALGLLSLPWAFKFLWAPLLDQRGTRRAWLLALQGSSVAGALLLTQLDLETSYALLFAAAFAFNLVAASQDVVTDGLAVRLLDVRERGLGNGLQVGAYRLGMILGGGLLLWIFARTNWSVMFLCMAGLLALTLLPVFRLQEPARLPVAWPARSSDLALAWLRRALQPAMLTLAGLIFCYRFGDQMVTSLLGPFLTDAGLDLETIALMKGAVGSATSLVGAALGGAFVFAVGRRRALLATGLAQAACFGLYIAAALDAGGVNLLWAATVLEGVVGTMATVALFTLMMDAADPEHAGTDYTLLASTVVLVGSIAGLVAALIADAIGYAPTFIIGATLAAAGCLFLVWWLDRRAPPGRVANAWRPYSTSVADDPG